MGYEILSAVDQYGNELNTEVKRKLMQRCIMAPRFLREMLAGFHDARQNIMWVKPDRTEQRELCYSDGHLCRYDREYGPGA